jgi:hypothetical protein
MTLTPTTPAPSTVPTRGDPAAWIPGLILVTFGVVLLAIQQFGLNGDVIVLLIGLAFAVGYAATRTYGLLVPAGILSGLGSGILLEDYYPQMNEPVVLGLGLGFLAIYLVDSIVAGNAGVARWWPLVPGGILTTVAISNGVFGSAGAAALKTWWPVLLIVVGAFLLLRRAVPIKTG